MYLLGHLGLTLLAGAAVLHWRRALRDRLPLGWLLLGSVLPDLVDKPLGLVLGWGYGRLFLHTALSLVVLSAATAAAWKRWPRAGAALLALTVGSAGHLALDHIWDVPQVLWWPLLGSFPDEGWTVARYAGLLTQSRYILAMEGVGAAALGLVGVWAWRRQRALRDGLSEGASMHAR